MIKIIIRNNLIEFLEISRKLSGSEICITDLNCVKYLTMEEKVENTNISDDIKIFLNNFIENKNAYVCDNEIEILSISKSYDTKCSALIILPLFEKDKIIGTLIYFKYEGKYNDKDVEFVKTAREFIYKFFEKEQE